MQRAQVLRAAGEAVMDRGVVYGPPQVFLERVARFWNAHMRNRGLLAHTYGVNEADVAQMLGFIKDARLAEDQTHRDSWVDKAGYAAIGAEVAHAAANDDEQPFKSAYEVSTSVNFHPLWHPAFDFKLGETVNLVADSVGNLPGVVAKFALDEQECIGVQWPHFKKGDLHFIEPESLRHGP